MKAHSKPVMLIYERLETSESKLRAKNHHFTNSIISEESFMKLRAKARKIDEDTRQLAATGLEEDLDPEVREQMRQFELMEQAEKNALLLASLPMAKLTSKLSRQTSLGTIIGGSDSPPHFPFRNKSWLFSRDSNPRFKHSPMNSTGGLAPFQKQTT